MTDLNRMYFESWCYEAGYHPQQIGLWEAWQHSKTYIPPTVVSDLPPVTFDQYIKLQDEIIEKFRKTEEG